MSNDLSVIDQFHCLTKVDHLKEVVEANMGVGASVDIFGLERIRLAAGGARGFVIESDIGEEPETIGEFDAVITDIAPERLYWEEAFSSGGGGAPPSCISKDLIYGFGRNRPGMEAPKQNECVHCPQNQWGSDPRPDSEGKACREVRKLFLLRRADSLFPSLMIVPPGSLKPMLKHLQGLTSRGLPYYALINTFSTEIAKSESGVKFAQLNLRASRVLRDDEIDRIKQYKTALSSVLRQSVVDIDPDVSVD